MRLVLKLTHLQVVAVADALLRTPSMAPLRAARVSAQHPPGRNPADILVCTPAALTSATQSTGTSYAGVWSTRALLAGCVLDMCTAAAAAAAVALPLLSLPELD